jgi:hypothetical protein
MVMYIKEVAMSETMVRKQIYIPKRQDALLKRLAKQRGVSEAEIIRQALEREVDTNDEATQQREKALESMVAFARSLRERPEFQQGEPYKWNRQEQYEERESRWFKSPEQEK